MRVRERRPWLVAFEVLLAAAVGYFVWRALRGSWTELTRQPLPLALRMGPLAVAASLVLATYALLIESWRRLLVAWGQRLGWPAAASIWAVSNLGRYLPGKVWAVAGMAALAQRAGVSPWTATAAAVMLQIVSLGTGAAVAAATAPGTASAPWIAAAAGVAALTVVAVTWPPAAEWIRRFLPALPPAGARGARLQPVIGAVGATAAAWLSYGLALWWLARAVLPSAALPLPTAVGAFATSYLVGLLAIFAPGGVGVREGMLFGLLEPALGAGGALSLSLASRVLLSGTELVAATAGWLLGQAGKDRRP